MIIGSASGSDVPWSFSFMSFIAMENSSLSIFPSLFRSAKVLRARTKADRGECWSSTDFGDTARESIATKFEYQ